MFLLVPDHPGSPGQTAVKRLLFVVTEKNKFLLFVAHYGYVDFVLSVASLLQGKLQAVPLLQDRFLDFFLCTNRGEVDVFLVFLAFYGCNSQRHISSLVN